MESEVTPRIRLRVTKLNVEVEQPLTMAEKIALMDEQNRAGQQTRLSNFRQRISSFAHVGGKIYVHVVENVEIRVIIEDSIICPKIKQRGAEQ